MLYSEIKGWHWIITWDNPVPADSSAIVAALSALGKLTKVQTKTTYILAPKKHIGWRPIRNAITGNLHRKKGNVVYVNPSNGPAKPSFYGTGLTENPHGRKAVGWRP
jgi:hypothetical protein